MTQKRTFEFKDDDKTFDLNQRILEIIKPGLYYGFDAQLNTGLSLILEHNTSGVSVIDVDELETAKRGVYITKQGVLVKEDSNIQISIDPGDSVNPRIDLIVAEHIYLEVTGGQPAVYYTIKGTPSSNPVAPSLTNSKRQTILGQLYVPSNMASLDEVGVTYTKSEKPEFSGNNFLDRILANENSIQNNANDISDNAADILLNANNIANNTANISQNASDIQDNASDISQNASNIQVNANDINTLDEVKISYKTSASGLPSSTGAGTIDIDRANNYWSNTQLSGNVTWGITGSVGGIRPGRKIYIAVKTGLHDILLQQSGITFIGDINNGYVQNLDESKVNLLSIETLTSTLIWVKLIKQYNGEEIYYEFGERVEISTTQSLTSSYRDVIIDPPKRISKCNLRVNINYSGTINNVNTTNSVKIEYQKNGTGGAWTNLLTRTANGAFSGSVYVDLDKEDTLFIKIELELGQGAGQGDGAIITLTLDDGEFVGNCAGVFTVGDNNQYEEQIQG